MPNLRYLYRMNEPFVGGQQAIHANSHDQIEFKKKFVYGLDDATNLRMKMMGDENGQVCKTIEEVAK